MQAACAPSIIRELPLSAFRDQNGETRFRTEPALRIIIYCWPPRANSGPCSCLALTDAELKKADIPKTGHVYFSLGTRTTNAKLSGPGTERVFVP